MKYSKVIIVLLIILTGCSMEKNDQDSAVTKLSDIEKEYNLPIVSKYVDNNEKASDAEKFLKLKSEDVEKYRSLLLDVGFAEEVIQGIDGQQYKYILKDEKNDIKISIVDSTVTDVYIKIRFEK